MLSVIVIKAMKHDRRCRLPRGDSATRALCQTGPRSGLSGAESSRDSHFEESG